MLYNANQYILRKEVVAGFTHYYVSFGDGTGNPQEIEVPRGVFLELLRFMKRERNLRRWDERYIEQSALTQETLHRRAICVPKSIEDVVCDSMRDERLRQALMELPDIQRRRIYLHCVLGLTFPQIARIEHCSKRAVKQSVFIAKEKLKKKFQK